MIKADRLNTFQPGVFSMISEKKKQASSAGKDIIDLSIGNPDMAPPSHVKEAFLAAAQDDKNYGYALTEGLEVFKNAVVSWYDKNYGVQLDPTHEVLSLMGSQDGLTHLHWALLNPGDLVLIPDPSYPIYQAGPLLAGGKIYPLPLLEENDYLPDLESIPAEIAARAKVMILNYPSNPLAATASKDFFEDLVAFAKKHQIIIVHDFAYSELSYDGFKNTSFLGAAGAKEVGVEIHSVSKTYNLAGCRLGFIVGNAEVIDALRLVKSNIDYGTFSPVQIAAASALTGPAQCVKDNALNYQQRRDVLIEELAKYGWQVAKPKASMFVWAKLPERFPSSEDFTFQLLAQTGVAVVPGVAFGAHGEGYVRIGLVQDKERIREAGKRIGEFIYGPLL